MGTAKTGYIQRRIIKVCEDIQVKYDGTVRDTNGKVYQMSYGDTGMDASCTVKVGNAQQPCDIARMVARLNLQHNIKLEQNKNPKVNPKVNPLMNTLISTSKKMPSRISLLKALAKKTGRKKLYKGVSINKLSQMLMS